MNREDTITRALLIAAADAAGQLAYEDDFPTRAPFANVTVRDLLKQIPPAVDNGAADIFAAYSRGWDTAADAECARILAQD